MDPRVLEVSDISTVTEGKGESQNNALQDEARELFMRPNTTKDTQSITSGDSNEGFLEQRARANSENPEVKEAYRQFLEATKGMDPKLVEDSLNLATDLAEKGLSKIPGLGGGDAAKAPEGEEGLVDPRVSGVLQTIMRKFTNPLVVRDIIMVGKDLVQIAMSPQGRQLITDLKSLVKNLKDA